MNIPKNIENDILKILEKRDGNGRLSYREKTNLEYKESFVAKKQYHYAKTMAAFANRSGGLILFGIKDSPREIIGVGNGFNDIPLEKFTDILNSTFSPEIDYEIGSFEYNSKIIGYIYTYQALNKPIMALKNVDSAKIVNGDVYYRYHARSERIKFSELQKIIIEKEENIRSNLLKSFESIIKSGTTNIGIVNYDKGIFKTPNGIDVSVDKSLIVKVLKHARFIKEGQFNETTGRPVLKVTGEINLSEEASIPDIDPDIQYPYIQSQLADKLGIKPYDVRVLIHKYNIKNDKKFHVEITTSKSGSTHKFSDLALQELTDILNYHKDDANFLSSVVKEYYRAVKDKQYN